MLLSHESLKQVISATCTNDESLLGRVDAFVGEG